MLLVHKLPYILIRSKYGEQPLKFRSYRLPFMQSNKTTAFPYPFYCWFYSAELLVVCSKHVRNLVFLECGLSSSRSVPNLFSLNFIVASYHLIGVLGWRIHFTALLSDAHSLPQSYLRIILTVTGCDIDSLHYRITFQHGKQPQLLLPPIRKVVHKLQKETETW